jgi:hypothetical protein
MEKIFHTPFPTVSQRPYHPSAAVWSLTRFAPRHVVPTRLSPQRRTLQLHSLEGSFAESGQPFGTSSQGLYRAKRLRGKVQASSDGFAAHHVTGANSPLYGHVSGRWSRLLRRTSAERPLAHSSRCSAVLSTPCTLPLIPKQPSICFRQNRSRLLHQMCARTHLL